MRVYIVGPPGSGKSMVANLIFTMLEFAGVAVVMDEEDRKLRGCSMHLRKMYTPGRVAPIHIITRDSAIEEDVT